MGEVYRADDLKLGEAVALKFLTVEMAGDSDMVQRFHEEVRIARQVSHPNICTVHDIGEVDGHPYLSMEYVDGEDLASLLRRVGRLSPEKAAELGRQVCAGLAAAHRKGVIHRDLKPSNILIDGQGQARITDFGLAAATRQITGVETRSGTPAYMSPEQLAGEEVTAASDIYSLGLVLYELFSGQKAFSSDTLAHRMQDSQVAPASVSRVALDINPAVDRVISMCLESDPSSRPASPLEISAALPGSDRLAASLEAGETPSPGIVAAAGSSGALPAWVAASCLTAIVAGCIGLAAVSEELYLFRRVPLDKPPDALVEQARQLIATAGYDENPADWARGFFYRTSYIRYIRDEIDQPGKWDRLSTGQPAAVGFWYRQSPSKLIPLNLRRRVQPTDPPLTLAGMTTVGLDTEGRLLSFDRVPPSNLDAQATQKPNWKAFFDRAALDLASFSETAPRFVPSVFADQRLAWVGRYSEAPDVEIGVEAGSAAGRPVYFRIVEPWTDNDTSAAVATSASGDLGSMVFLAVILSVAVFLARRNIVKGRGDRTGANRVAGCAFLGLSLSALLSADHLPSSIRELEIGGPGPLLAAPLALLVWVVYVAVEPYLRRIWPHLLISWERLLRGEWRDPMVGRDILVGGTLAVLTGIGIVVMAAREGWQNPPITPTLRPLLGIPDALSVFLETLTFNAPFNPILTIFVILLLRVIFRRLWLALTVTGVLIALAIVAQTPADLLLSLTTFILVVLNVLSLAVLLRFGILALMVSSAFQMMVTLYPASVEMGAWYGTTALMPYLVILGAAGFGCYTSIAGATKTLLGSDAQGTP